MSDDLAAFLLARIADDEQVAREAGPGTDGCELYVLDDDYKHESIVISHTRILAECEAKRRSLDVVRADLADDVTDETAGYLLRLLALPYREHPDYRAEWAP